MLTQICTQSQPLESPPLQGLITDGVHEVLRALFTCKVSVVVSPALW